MQGSRLRVSLTLVAALVVLLSAAASSSAAAAPIKLGVYVASQGRLGAPEEASVLDEYATMVGRRPDIVMDYSNITDPLLTRTEVANLQARGETPMVTWQLYKSGWSGPTIPLAEVAAGSYDSQLRRAAEEAKSMPFGEILIRFGHEMNGDWYGWSGDPASYVAAWRHVVSVFREAGTSNVRWVWAPNVDYGNYPFRAYFPGDEWVDYVGLDGYNWGRSGLGTNRWQDLREVFQSSYEELGRLSSKPVIITEVASSEVGGSKADWIRAGFLEAIPRYFKRVQAVVWFDRDQEQDWRIDSSASSLAAYREVVASTLYGGTEPPPAEGSGEVTISELEVRPAARTASKAPVRADSPGQRPGAASPTTIPGSAPLPSRSQARRKVRRARRLVRAHGRVIYRVRGAPRAVRLTVRGPGLGRGHTRSVTIRNPHGRGQVPITRLTRTVLPHRRYRLIATAIGGGGVRLSSRAASFKVAPGTGPAVGAARDLG